MATDITDQTSNFQYILRNTNYSPYVNPLKTYKSTNIYGITNYSPYVNPLETLQKQFTNIYGDYFKVQQPVDFQFSITTFLDLDNINLIYTIASILPNWLTFLT